MFLWYSFVIALKIWKSCVLNVNNTNVICSCKSKTLFSHFGFSLFVSIWVFKRHRILSVLSINPQTTPSEEIASYILYTLFSHIWSCFSVLEMGKSKKFQELAQNSTHGRNNTSTHRCSHLFAKTLLSQYNICYFF